MDADAHRGNSQSELIKAGFQNEFHCSHVQKSPLSRTTIAEQEWM